LTLKKHIKKLKTKYVIHKIQQTKIPYFEPSPLIRQRIIFIGKVQKVGFRLEIDELARRLGLAGYARNKKRNSNKYEDKVELEIQGEEKKIDFLVENMTKLKRAKVIKVEKTKLEVMKGASGFSIVKG